MNLLKLNVLYYLFDLIMILVVKINFISIHQSNACLPVEKYVNLMDRVFFKKIEELHCEILQW